MYLIRMMNFRQAEIRLFDLLGSSRLFDLQCFIQLRSIYWFATGTRSTRHASAAMSKVFKRDSAKHFLFRISCLLVCLKLVDYCIEVVLQIMSCAKGINCGLNRCVWSVNVWMCERWRRLCWPGFFSFFLSNNTNPNVPPLMMMMMMMRGGSAPLPFKATDWSDVDRTKSIALHTGRIFER